MKTEFISVRNTMPSIFPHMIAKAVLPQKIGEEVKPCECGNEVSEYQTKLIDDFPKKDGEPREEFELKLFPQKCETCKNVAYELHLYEEAVLAHSAKINRCGGHQNRKLRHFNVAPTRSLCQSMPSQADAMKYFDSLLSGEVKTGAYIYGPTGTGKTYLAKMLNNELVEKYRDVCFIKAVDMAMLLRRESYSKEPRDLIGEFRKVDILIIDDYGTQKNTEFVKEVIFSIFDSRYDAGKVTIITSNLDSDDLDEVDNRLASRIGDAKWMRKILIRSGDLRLTWDNID